MKNKQIQGFSRALDAELGITNQISHKSDSPISASLEMAKILNTIPFEEETSIPTHLRQAWIEKTAIKKTKRFSFQLLTNKSVWVTFAIVFVVVLVGFSKPVFAAVSQAFGYVYISDVGFLPRSTTRILAQPVRQQHNELSLTVMRGVTTPAETILFLKFSPVAQPLDGAWLGLSSGEQLALKDWHYFPNQPNSTGVRVVFPPLPNDQDQAILALQQGWRLPLRWIPATQSTLADVQIIPSVETLTAPSTESENPCVTKKPVRLCLLAAASSTEGTSVLLQVDYLDPALQRSTDLGLTWQTESQPVQLITSQGEHVSLVREQKDTLFFPTLAAKQKVTLSIPAILADLDIPDQFITVNVGDNPQANQTIPLDAQVQVFGATIHFSKATLVGDDVNSLRLTLNADEPIPSFMGITPILLELGKPENIDDLYGSGLLTGEKDLFVELIRPSGKIHGKITLPIIKASVIVPGPFEFPFTIPAATEEKTSLNGSATPPLLEANPANFAPFATPTPLPLDGYQYTGEPIQPSDLLYSLSDGNHSQIYLVNPGQPPRQLANLPGVVTQVFVHPDHGGIDYLAGVSKTKDEITYVDELQLYRLRFDQPAPLLLFRFPPNPDNLIGTAISGSWSFDGHFGIFRLPNSAPGNSTWRYLWIDLQCTSAASCQAKELALPPNLDLFSASFAPKDYRILFTGNETLTGKNNLFMLDFQPNQPPGPLQNLTGAYTVGDGITPAQWSDAGYIFTVCALDSQMDPSAFCWLDPKTGQLTQVDSVKPNQNGMRLYGNYWISGSGKYLAALFFPTNALEGETVPTLRLVNLDQGEMYDLDFAKIILASTFSADERYLAYVAQSDHELKMVSVDLHSNSTQTIFKLSKTSPVVWINWVK